MVDTVSKSERSRIMRLVKQKNTKPEIVVRSYLHRAGLRFRLHSKKLPGKPDLVLPKYNTVLFVNGCFWHGHDSDECKLARIPKSNVEFWKNKIQTNRLRDTKNIGLLESAGWRVLVVWECQINATNLERLVNEIKSYNSTFS